MKVKLLTYTPNPEKIIAMAGKLCYAGCSIDELEQNLTTEEIEKFVGMLKRLGHESPLEHTSFTFAVEDVSRVTEQQLTRHRLASYSIQSGRYVNRDNASFYIPKEIKNSEDVLNLYNNRLEGCKDTYKEISNELILKMIEDFTKTKCEFTEEKEFVEKFKQENPRQYGKIEKKAIENARMIFPNSLNTKIIFTMNLRSLMNFFEHRCCLRSQDEIRQLANLMLSECKKVSPILFNGLGASCITKGYCPEGVMQCEELKGKIPTLKQLKDNYFTQAK